MNRKHLIASALVLVFLPLSLFLAPKSAKSVPPTNVKDTLSSAQLSYFARLGVGNSAGDYLFKIALTGNPSNTTDNLFHNDTIGVGRSDGPGLDSYTVLDIASTAAIQVGSSIATNNAATGNMVVATRSAIHTVAFTPQSSIAGGAWQFLIKATSRTGETNNDGIPDQQGFDLGGDYSGQTIGSGTQVKTADIACPFGTASVGDTAIVGSSTYHVITCTLGAGTNNPVGVGQTIVIGRDLSVGSQLINPSASVSRAYGDRGLADLYDFYIRHLDASSQVVSTDTIKGRIAVVEAVKVTATVDPSLTFSIDNTNVGTGTTRCGNVLGASAANTTPITAAFGSLNIASFNNLAHRLSAVTNAKNGYAVTVYEADYMTNVNTGTTIPNTTCGGACSYTSAGTWNTTTDYGWGYSMENASGTPATFTYATGYKAFGYGASQAQAIMSSATTPSSTETAYICYRLNVSTSQEAGNYENRLVYTATATF